MPASKDELAQAVRGIVARAEALAGQLSEADWEKPTYEQGWTVKQVFCHLASTGGAIPFLLNLASSPPPPGAGAGGGGFDIDAWNAQQVAARQNNSVSELLAEIRSSRESSIQALQGVSEELLAKVISVPWGLSGTLAEMIGQVVAQHEQGHLDDVARAVGRA